MQSLPEAGYTLRHTGAVRLTRSRKTWTSGCILALDVINGIRYYLLVIAGFADRETERLFMERRSRKYPPDIRRVALRKLAQLDAVTELQQLAVPPGNRLEKLKGNRKGQYSIRINDQWRICFRWRESEPHEVEITDYH